MSQEKEPNGITTQAFVVLGIATLQTLIGCIYQYAFYRIFESTFEAGWGISALATFMVFSFSYFLAHYGKEELQTLQILKERRDNINED